MCTVFDNPDCYMNSMKLLLLFMLGWCSLSVAQSTIATGVVVPKVQMDATTSETYAIYLPRAYDASQKYPTVFIFNTLENTASVVQQFTIGAELTQSIIVGANYMMSDSLNVALKQSEKIINTVFDQFSVDPDKIILAGFNNGALIASTSAHLSEDVYGVIAVGDVFIDRKLLKKKNKPVRFSILSSNEGKKFYKLAAYENGYGLKDIVHGYYEYDRTGWPQSGYLSASLTNILLSDATPDETVEAYYKSEMEFARKLVAQEQYILAYDYTAALKAKYKKRLDIKEQKELFKYIRGSKFYRIKRLRETTVRNNENFLLQDFNYYLTEDSNNAFFDNLGWWSYQMDELDLKVDSTATSKEERKSALRLRNFLIGATEEKSDLLALNNGSDEQLLFINVLRTLVDPLNKDAYRQAISLSAKEGDYNAALFYLEELMKTGYNDYEEAYTIENTISLRTGPEFNEIIKAYFGKSKYYDD